jgi:hypothetical protein
MALKKSFKSGKQYNYASIDQVHYQKKQFVTFYLKVYEKDSSWLPVKEKIIVGEDENGKPVFEEIIKEEPVDKITDMNFTISMSEKNSKKEGESFTMNKISQKDNNIIRSCYKWLKKNVDMFNDWEDC